MGAASACELNPRQTLGRASSVCAPRQLLERPSGLWHPNKRSSPAASGRISTPRLLFPPLCRRAKQPGGWAGDCEAQDFHLTPEIMAEMPLIIFLNDKWGFYRLIFWSGHASRKFVYLHFTRIIRCLEGDHYSVRFYEAKPVVLHTLIT